MRLQRESGCGLIVDELHFGWIPLCLQESVVFGSRAEGVDPGQE